MKLVCQFYSCTSHSERSGRDKSEIAVTANRLQGRIKSILGELQKHRILSHQLQHALFHTKNLRGASELRFCDLIPLHSSYNQSFLVLKNACIANQLILYHAITAYTHLVLGSTYFVDFSTTVIIFLPLSPLH